MVKVMAETPCVIETHAHLSRLDECNARFNARHEGAAALTQGLFDAGFGGIIDIGAQAEDLPPRIAAFSRFERVRFTAGLWPNPADFCKGILLFGRFFGNVGFL